MGMPRQFLTTYIDACHLLALIIGYLAVGYIQAWLIFNLIRKIFAL